MATLAELGPVRATFRGSLRLIRGLTIVFAVLFSLAVAYRYWKTGDSAEVMATAPSLAYVLAGLVALLAAFVKLHVTRVHEFGLNGRNFWSFPVRLGWADIEGWRLDSSSGFSAVVLVEKNSNREMWIFRDVFFSDPFQEQLRHFSDSPISEIV
jgi:hypothetical protein